MSKYKLTKDVKVTSKTIDKVWITQDYRKAIAEYIWNWFDAWATEIEINFEPIPNTSYITEFDIVDNWNWICYETLESTFWPILDSQKDIWKNNSFYTRWKKWKGRFSFLALSSKVEWDTIYKSWEINYNYQIQILSSNKNQYSLTDNQLTQESTWTSVKFTNLQKINADLLESKEFLEFLQSEFAWFLYLHKSSNYNIKVNWKSLEYDEIIVDSDTKEIKIENEKDKKSFNFSFYYILWKKKIWEDSQNYYRDSNKKPVWQKDTWFNRKWDNFNHSIYIVSDFFDNFEIVEKWNSLDVDLFWWYTNKHKIFRDLEKELREFLSKKKREFLKRNSEQLIEKLYEEWVMPSFWSTRYDYYVKEDFEDVVKEIYIFEPQIFEQKTNKQQKKTILEFLKLLLDDNKREKIVDIMKWIVDMTQQEVEEFHNVLTKTKLANISKLANFLINRKEVVLSLDKLVFDLKKFTNERDHIQKIIENNYWLFWEQYNLVSADKNFSKLAEEYYKIIWISEEKIDDSTMSKRRPDIFMVRNKKLPANNNKYDKVEHIIVELKRPSQKIWTEQFRQIEDYMEIVKNNSQFNWELDVWKFYVIWNELDSFVTDKYDSFKNYDDPFLVAESKWKFRIYVLTWRDLFVMFENTHQYLIDHLDIDDEKLKEELRLGLFDESKESVELIVEKII